MASPFQFLNNNKTIDNVCKELFTSEEQRPTWEEASDQCQLYREFMSSSPIPPDLRVNAYLLKKEDIDELLSQGGGLDGVRIYIGHELFGANGYAVRLFSVACKKNDEGKYDDWNIPADPKVFDGNAILGESRPCPRECGSRNILNP